MTNATPPLDNFERLSKQLKSGSLAARLVAAYIAAGDAAARGAALKAVISVRLNELRQSHAAGTDQ
jgi:hypothetical protein